MRCVDVNVLVYAHRPESPDHADVRRWLDDARRGLEPLGLPSVVASGFVRIVTHPRIFNEPTPVATALAFIDELRRSPSVVPAEPGDRHWPIFAGLLTSLRLRGNDIQDAYLGAIAIEHGATWVSADRGFARFSELRVEFVPPAGR